MKLGTMLDTTVHRDPQKEALVYGDERFTYAQLRGRALKAARVLEDSGVGPAEVGGGRAFGGPRAACAALVPFTVPGFVFAAFGAWSLGATVVPVTHKMQAPEVAYTTDHSGARLGIVSAELAETARAGAPDIPWLETESDAADSFDARL